FESFKKSTKIKHLKQIITQTNVNKWNEEINDLSINLFIVKLLKSYKINFDILKDQYYFIEESLNYNQNTNNDDVLSNLWQNKIKHDTNSNEIIDFINEYSKENIDKYNSETSLDCLIIRFIEEINSIKNFKMSIDTLYFFIGYENFMKLTEILQLKLLNSKSVKI
ncbi:unnamed protein product, partial [Rotaria sordida]